MPKLGKREHYVSYTAGHPVQINGELVNHIKIPRNGYIQKRNKEIIELFFALISTIISVNLLIVFI